MHAAAPIGVGNADRDDVVDVRVLGEGGLDLGREDVRAAGHDHVGAAVGDEIAGFIDPAEVADADEPVRRRGCGGAPT